MSSAVSFPTGGGKSTLAELKIAAALLGGGQVVVLAPTLALVDQTAFTLGSAFKNYTVLGDLDDEITFSDVLELPEIIVTTPERCLVLQSIQPEAFAQVALVVFDECHLLHPRESDRSRRAIDAMLCILNLTTWNSEVGSKTLGIATFYLRAVCMNRNLWGVENFEELSIRHSKFAANRFAHQAAPALTSFADSSPANFISGIKTARERIVARTEDDRADFLRGRGFSKADASRVIATVLDEEGYPPASLYDFVQGITAVARSRTRQDERLELEGKARKLLERAN